MFDREGLLARISSLFMFSILRSMNKDVSMDFLKDVLSKKTATDMVSFQMVLEKKLGEVPHS